MTRLQTPPARSWRRAAAHARAHRLKTLTCKVSVLEMNNHDCQQLINVLTITFSLPLFKRNQFVLNVISFKSASECKL